MRVLIACEESQEVCKAFRERGHEAYSCDIQECSGGHPEWHICKDVTAILNGNVAFITQDGKDIKMRTDCSGFVSLVYDTFGVVTSAASDDYQAMSNISYEELEPGDIVVYGDGSHVAIYEGDDMVIHCSNPESGTIESNINYREPTGYVRIIEDQIYEEEYGDD